MASTVVSSDDHVVEHPSVWTDRLSKARWGDRIPHVEEENGGAQFWVIDGSRLPLLGDLSLGALTGEDEQKPVRWEQVPKAAHDPSARMKAMDADGVDHAVLYPGVSGLAGDVFGAINDTDLELACVQAYNDWLIDEWVGASNRFVPQCIVPIASVETTIREIERAVARGHKGVIYPSNPMALRNIAHLNEPIYDPMWEICAELQVPLCFHSSSSADLQLAPYSGFAPEFAAAFKSAVRPASNIPVLSNLLISRILERHPSLKVVFGESSLGWLTFMLEYIENQFTQFRLQREMNYSLTPFEMFQRQCYATTWYDDDNLETVCDNSLSDNVLWASNFPQVTSTWPSSRSFIAARSAKVPSGYLSKVVGGNAAKLYRL